MKAVVQALLAAALVGGAGCGKHLYSRNDLDVDLSRHHIDLRWGRVAEAARRVHPDLRTAFLQDWSRRAGEIELQDLEVVGVTEGKDGDSADVVLNVTWMDRATMQVKRSTVVERWSRTDEGWRVVRPIELPVDVSAP